MEIHLGPIDTWPSYIIEYLFVNTPTPQVVKELSAFFFGNGLSNSLAYRLYHACNPTSTTESVRELFYVRYFLWQKSKYVLRMSTYYNVLLIKFVYLSSSYYTQFDPIEPAIGMSAPNLGIDITCCTNIVRCMLERVREGQA
jgi:hypothetical protein